MTNFLLLDNRPETEGIFVVASRTELTAVQVSDEVGRAMKRGERYPPSPSALLNRRGEMVWGSLRSNTV